LAEAAQIDATFIIIVTGSLVAAIFNAAFSAGGALIVLAITSTVLPVQAIVPIHSTLLIGSTATRIVFFRQFIDWKMVWPFLVGSLAGALLGARVYIELPEAIIAIAISILMLVALWLPQVKWRPKIRHPWVIVGFLHTLISTLFAYGALFHSVILHTDLERRQIVGTMAGCLTGMSIFKITGYVWYGFDYSPYLAIIVAAVAVSFIGTAIGKKLGDHLPEDKFRLAFRILVTVTAIRLLYAGLR
jgi:uncharacterized membrane protein YfcA